MEEVDDRDIYEWTIVNFSYWNSKVHGSVIRSSSFYILCGRCGSFRLYPRDLNGCGENLVVEWKCNELYMLPSHFAGDLSLISSNESLICSQQIDRVRTGDRFTFSFPLLKFGDLVAQIRKNEDDHQDQLNVRLSLKALGRSSKAVEHIRTTIEVHDVSVKIPSGKFNELIEGNFIDVIRIPLYDDCNDTVQIDLYKKYNSYSSIIKFFNQSRRKLFVSTRTSVLNTGDTVLKTVDYEHVFSNDGEKETLISLTEEEVKEKHCSLFISIKIIPPDSRKFYGRIYIGKGIYLKPPNFLKSRSFSPTDESTPSSSKIVPASYSPDNAVAVLTKELMCLFQDQEFSDFQLKCGGVSVPVHKNILSARSPVFKRLLSSDMREAASGAVDIEDLDAPTLARFLAFLYTGTVEDLQGDSALKLYYAADKYEVPSLKSECVSVLCASVSVSNVSDVLSLADKHQDNQLTSLAHDFILRNFDEVLGSSEWESFMNREPLLVAKTLTQLGQKKKILSAGTS